MLQLISVFFISVMWVNYSKASNSEFLFQADQKQSYVSVDFNNSANYLRSNSGMPYSVESKMLYVNYEYGFSKNLSAYGNISYHDYTAEGFIRGIGPLVAGGKYNREIGSGTLFMDLNLFLNILEGKRSCGTDTCSLSNSMISSRLKLGYQWRLDNAFTGFLVSHGVFSTKQKSDNGSSEKMKPYLTLSAFYERFIGENLWGLALSYISKGGLLGTTEYFPLVSNSFLPNYFEGIDSLALKAYLRTSLTENHHLITAVEYSKIINDKESGITNKSNVFNFNFTYRFLF